MQLQSLLLQHIIPAAGGVTSTLIFLSSYRRVAAVNQAQLVGDINSFPFNMMMVNSLAWVLYSLLLKDYYILIPNILGVDFGLYYSLSTFRYSSTLAQHSTIRTIIGFSTFLFIGTGCTFISVGDFKTQSTLLGLLCVIVLICFYSSPLSTILKVVETKNSASIDPLLAWATITNGSLWTIYGLTLGNPFIWSPNLLGIFFALIQIIALVVLRKPYTETTDLVESPVALSEDMSQSFFSCREGTPESAVAIIP